MAYVLFNTLYYFVRLLEILIFVRVILSWLPVDTSRGLPGLIYTLTEPILGPIRNLLRRSPLGGLMIDFSPVIAVLLIDVVYNLLVNILAQLLF